MSGGLDESDIPVRPQASPRYSPTCSARSSFSCGSSDYSRPHPESSGAQSPTRGRTTARSPPQRSHNRRMTTLHKDPLNPVGWDSTILQSRLMSRDLTAEPQGMLDLVKEPLPFGVERYRSSLSEELYRTATWDTLIDVSRFGEHRDTFAIYGFQRLQSDQPLLPEIFFEGLLRYIDHETYMAIRLSCRQWSEAITRARCLLTSPALRLPFEIFEKIFVHLNPTDFDSARHTCRLWMISSLQESLIALMLRRGGWSRAVKADIEWQAQKKGHGLNVTVNEEWISSKRLATECSLQPNWKGNGFDEVMVPPSCEEKHQRTIFSITSITDFSELSNGSNAVSADQNSQAVHFTVSACQRYLLVTEGCLIYVYSIQPSTSNTQLHGGPLTTIATVVCPHRVLAVSMDTSSQRFAVAALMDDRSGLVCDISGGAAHTKKSSIPRALPTSIRDSKGQVPEPRSSSEQGLAEVMENLDATAMQHANDRAIAQAIADATLPEIHGARSTRQSWTVNDPLLCPIDVPDSSEDGSVFQYPMPIATGARSIYRNLCSVQDPPRSIAICPNRRCVAFGCASGIELHWIDALTGQDLSRWFPLTAPSDFLYFLSPRPGLDSTKKLRIISSAAHPAERERPRSWFFAPRDRDVSRYQTMTWDEEFQGVGLGGSAWWGGGFCDHYQSVPLSDGCNILYTDPDDTILCLSSNSTPRDRPAKVARKFTFVGPTDLDESAIIPRVYASGRELSWGVRIAVVYGDALWFFVIPPDVYFADQSSTGVDTDETNEGEDRTPVQIEGIEIAKMPGLVDVAVDASGGDITLWAFAADGMGYTWQLNSGARSAQELVVARDGTIMPTEDSDGDAFMHNTTTPAVHFDGNTAVPPGTKHSWRDHLVDQDGDVTMPDIVAETGDFDPEFVEAGDVFAIHVPPLHERWSDADADWVPDYLQERGSGIDDEGVGVDVLQMSRVEVEVLSG